MDIADEIVAFYVGTPEEIVMERAATLDRESRLIVDSIPGMVALLAPTGEVDFVNPQLLDYFGQTIHELKNWGTNGTIHPEDLPNVVDIFTRSISGGTPYQITQRARRSDGVYRWVQNSGFPLRDETGQVLRWCVLLTDIDERKHAEDALRESERQFKTIFDEAGTGISMVDLKVGEPIRNNRALQRMLGCTEDELSRFATFDDLTYEADRVRDAATFRELRDGRRDTLRLEKHFVLRDGGSVWADVIFTLLRDDDGNPRYIIAMHENITERKRAIQELEANKELLELAQKAARAMAFDWHIQDEINSWSPEQEALYGLPPGTFDGKYESWKRLIYPPDWPGVVEALKAAQHNGEISAEFRVVWPDGSVHWLMARGQMFFDDRGVPIRMVGFTADITAMKLVEEELRRSEAFLAEGQHLARMGNFAWRVSTNEITWSEQLYRIYEVEAGTPITLELIRTRVHPEDVSLYEKMVEEARSGDDFEWQYRLLMPDGSIKYMHAVAHATHDHDGQLEYIAAVQDVTARRQSQVALDEARAELGRAARAMSLGVLTASIAHEVNQPLAGIITNASTCVRMLDADPPNVDGARETARRTIRDGNRASDVITRLRALFGRKEFTVESIDLNEAVLEVIELSRSELQNGQIVMRLELATDLPPVEGDRVQLQQVILNLLLNAADAMSEVDDRPRELTISTAVDGDEAVRLSVRDEGIGVAPQDVAKLFTAFYTTKKTGMGIGLSVSKSIIESHHGRLWATPNDGPGATFSFSIPRVPQTACR